MATDADFLFGKSGCCPVPKVYRYFAGVAWCILAVLTFGLFASYTSRMIWFMVLYLAGVILIVFGVHKVQKKLKEKGVSKESNVAATLFLSVFLILLMVGGLVAMVLIFDVRLTEKREAVDVILVNGREWEIYQDTLPLHVADFLYDFLLEEVYEEELCYWEDEPRPNMEYYVTFEGKNGTMYRKYCDDLPMAHDWLVLTRNKIVPMTLYLEDLTVEQMKIIVEKLAEK